MGQHKESILIWCLVVQLFTSLVLGGLASAGVVSGGIALQATGSFFCMVCCSGWNYVLVELYNFPNIRRGIHRQCILLVSNNR